MKPYKESIYTLEDRNESDISPQWLFIQELFFILCVGIGMVGCFCFSQVMSTMSHNCILFPKLEFRDDRFLFNNNSVPYKIHLVASSFHKTSCDLVLYLPILISTFASFFAVLFGYCGKGGAGNDRVPEAWRIVMPTVLFNGVCFVTAFVVGAMFYKGYKDFMFNVAHAWKVSKLDLNEIGHLYLEDVNVGDALIEDLSVTKHCVWMLVTSWGLNFCWIMLRCLFNVDFQLVRTTIHVFSRENTDYPKVLKKQDADVNDSDNRENVPGRSLRQRSVHFTSSTLFQPVLKDASTEVSESLHKFKGEDAPNSGDTKDDKDEN